MRSLKLVRDSSLRNSKVSSIERTMSLRIGASRETRSNTVKPINRIILANSLQLNRNLRSPKSRKRLPRIDSVSDGRSFKRRN